MTEHTTRPERDRSIVFVGATAGEVELAYLESRLPALLETCRPTALIVSGENPGLLPGGNCGMSPKSLAWLWALGVECAAGRSRSWDGGAALAPGAVEFGAMFIRGRGRAAPSVERVA